MKKLLFLSLVLSLVTINFVSAIDVTSLSELYTTDPIRIFEFTIVNDNGVALSDVSWDVDTRDNYIINSSQNVSLSAGENITVYVEYEFSTQGNFNVNVTARNGTLSDSDNLTVSISYLMVTELSSLYLNETEFVFEFIINNTSPITLTDINWSLNLSDGSIINSSTSFNLSSGEDIRVYVKHNYTTIGSYDVITRAYNSLYDNSKTVTFKTNTSPVISALPDVTFYEDEHNATIDLDIYVSDEDSDADLEWTAVGNSSSTVNVEILSGNFVNISGAQDYNNEPNGKNITFIVTDTDGLTNNDTILVIVEKWNDPPTIDWYTPDNNVTQFVPTNGELQFNHTSSDPDIGDVLTYNWSLDGITQVTTQAWLYQPILSDAGDHIVNLTVTDNIDGYASLRWNITVYLTYCNGNYNATMTEWTIDSDVKCENETIPLTADIIVQNNGNFTLRNVTLQVNSTSDGEYGITVESGGQMNIYDLDSDKSTTDDRSIIERIDAVALGYNIIINSGAVFKMKNSKLSGAGWGPNDRGLEISADNSIIQNNNITDDYNGLTISSDNNLIENNDFSENSNYGVYVSGLNNNISNNIINVSGGDAGIFASNIASGLSINSNVIGGPTSNFGSCIEFKNVNKSTISSNNVSGCDYGIFFDLKSQGQTINPCTYNIIEDSIISQSLSAGIYFKTALNNQIINTLISDNLKGIILQNGSVTEPGSDNNIIQDSTISNTEDEDILYNKPSKNNTLINTTFNISKVDSDGGNLTIKWYLDVYVNDSNGNAVNNVVVEGYDKNQNLEFSTTTNSSGVIERQIVEELTFVGDFKKDYVKVYKTNYTITASNITHEATTSVNLTDSKAISLTLELIPLNVYNFSVLNASGTERIFEFWIKNQLTTNLNNVSWEFDTKDTNVINSTENIILTPSETIFTYIEYNFSSAATYNVNATAINGTLTDSEDMSVTITT